MSYRKIGMIFLVTSVLLILIAQQQVDSNIIRDSEERIVSSKETAPVPAPVPNFENGEGLDVIYSDDVTTRRPQIGDIFGNGLQNIFQGLVKAPGQIASRVQGILDGILRRPTTTPAPIE